MSFKLHFREAFFNHFQEYIIHCSNLMLSDCSNKNIRLDNNENIIRNCFVSEYLNNDKIKNINNIKAIFEIETYENYDTNIKNYAGRCDIKVNTENTFINNKAYYIIECKRIDGNNKLNKKYIEEGIYRFVSEKYSSYYGYNIMFAFVVKDIDIIENTNTINAKQKEIDKIKNQVDDDFNLIKSQNNTYALYSSKYITTLKNNNLELIHLFYNFNSIIE